MDLAIACGVFRSKRHVFESSQGRAAEPTNRRNRRDAAAASLRFVSSAAPPWLLSKTCLLERKTTHAMAGSIITPRNIEEKGKVISEVYRYLVASVLGRFDR